VNSRLYIGRVSHTRSRPKRNTFGYGIYYLLVDIDEVDALDDQLRWFGHNSGVLVSLHDRDHGAKDGSLWRPWIEERLTRAGIDLEGGRIMLLTFPRVLGMRFYPVSFWYCYHSDGRVRAVLAEVNNTFGHHHNYLLHNSGAPFDFAVKPTTRKMFHVSPFIEMDAHYEFTLTEPGSTLAVKIEDFVEDSLLLVAGIDLRESDLSDRMLLRTVLRHGPISLVAWLRIHWQALRIVSKGIKYIPPTPPPEEETSLWAQGQDWQAHS
jgi:DUF1365 family protein